MPGLPDDHAAGTSGADGRWDVTEADTLRFVAAGDLDIDARRRITDALFEHPPGSAPRVEIDLGAVAFLDAGTAGIFARYADAAARRGGAVRVVNATGLPRYVLRMLGLAHLLDAGTAPPEDDRPIRRRPMPVAEVLAVSRAVTAASGEIVARSQALCRTAAGYRKRRLA